MHDTHLLEKIYNSLSEICDRNSIIKMNELCINVNENSHIDEKSLLQFLKDRDNKLYGDFTRIYIERCEAETLTATIKSIDGDKNE